MAAPEDAHRIGVAVHARFGPILGCDVLCRSHALVVCAVAAALDVPAEMVHIPHEHHFICRFGDGSVWFGEVRLRRASQSDYRSAFRPRSS